MGDFFPTFFHFAQPNVLVILQLLYPMIYVFKCSNKCGSKTNDALWILFSLVGKLGKKTEKCNDAHLSNDLKEPHRRKTCFCSSISQPTKNKFFAAEKTKVACFFSNSSCIFLCWYSMANELALGKNRLAWKTHGARPCSPKKKDNKNTKDFLGINYSQTFWWHMQQYFLFFFVLWVLTL